MMWLRLAGLAAATFGVIAALDGLDDDGLPAPSELAHGRWRELFWFLIFAFVMATAVWVAARRQGERLQHVLARAAPRR